ncbi:MAG: hypothetical protein E6K81_08045 [Candidatus Eisenbacteria bacterium]|uniref:Uncharacterized protein n=1 Tax=Eiseniibacteriota bacterium TaxID=2212470 RepID=A0A538U8G0_UNCEI|nr:MAG: hypothetical protein E6K81_08045 [Candidatus Eisenbacteria bacterium]
MRDPNGFPMRRVREVVFGLCAAWLVLQNLVLFAMFAWRPVTAVLVATHVLVRVALHAAVPMTVLPGGTLLDVATALLAAGTEVHHG